MPGKLPLAYLPPRELFFLSAHRFFIISDIRLRPSGVRRLRFFAGTAGAWEAEDGLGGTEGRSVSSKAEIALFNRSRSRGSLAVRADG